MRDSVRGVSVQPRTRRLTAKETESLKRRLYLFLQLGTLMSAQVEELERELRDVGAFQHDTKHLLRQIQRLTKKLWDGHLFNGMTPEQLGLFGKDGEQLEHLINGVINGRIKKIEYEVEDNATEE